jgi:hypothetical protein
VSFLRLTRGHAIAFVGALVLILSTSAVDWYTTDQGQEARRLQRIQGQPPPGPGGEVPRAVVRDADLSAERQERTAWEPQTVIEFVLLMGVLLAAGLAILAGFVRAAGREPPVPLLPLAGGLAGLTGALLLYRMLAGGDAGAQVEFGVPVALAALAAIAVGAALAGRSTGRESAED